MLSRIVVLAICVGLVANHVQAQPAGMEFYNDLSLLPYIFTDAEAHYISSYDRTGGNDDGFRGTYSQLYVDDKGEHVIFEEDGPGCIYNLWFTGNGQNLHWGKIRFYFDNEKTPRIEYEAREFFSGLHPPFVYPLMTHSFISSGGFSCSMPFPFARHLKVTTEKTVGFYNMYYQLYKDSSLESWSSRMDFAKLLDLFQSCGRDPKPSTKDIQVVRRTVSLATAARGTSPEVELLSLNQGGTIQHIKINPLYAPDSYALNHVNLRIYYDSQTRPAVDVPLGPFFGSGLGEAEVRGLLIGMSTSGAYYCYFPMPFKNAVRVTLQNRSYQAGGEFFCEAGYSDEIPPARKDAALGYFGAKYNNAWPITEPNDYVLLDYQGNGAIIGQVMTVEPVKPDRKRWWEGDMRIYIDGEPKPRFHGTGHEDEYQGGWSTFWLTNPYSLPLFGEPKTENLVDVFGQVNGSTTAYRFWPGKIHFAKSITISTEHGNHNDTPANYSSLVYYYYVPE